MSHHFRSKTSLGMQKVNSGNISKTHMKDIKLERKQGKKKLEGSDSVSRIYLSNKERSGGKGGESKIVSSEGIPLPNIKQGLHQLHSSRTPLMDRITKSLGRSTSQVDFRHSKNNPIIQNILERSQQRTQTTEHSKILSDRIHGKGEYGLEKTNLPNSKLESSLLETLDFIGGNADELNIINRNKTSIRNKYLLRDKNIKFKQALHSKEKRTIVEEQGANIMNRLSIDIKEYYGKKKPFLEIFDQIAQVNLKFMKTQEVVSCYRIELASELESIFNQYNLLFQRVVEETFINDLANVKHYMYKQKQFLKLSDQFELEKAKYEKKFKLLSNAIKAKNCEIRGIKLNETAMQAEIQNMREILSFDAKPNEYKLEEDDEGDGLAGGNFRKNLLRELTDEHFLIDNLDNLQNTFGKLETEHNSRSDMLVNMNKLIKGMLKSNKHTVAVQVDEGELYWSAKDFIGVLDNIYIYIYVYII